MEKQPGVRTKEKTIYVHSELCSGCGYCQLACSFVKTGAFSFADARISIRRANEEERYQVAFNEDCDRCGFCPRYCYFGVLEEVK